MDLAALIVSILAFLAAGASAWYARRQSQHARRLARYDAERRLSEREPTLSHEVERRITGETSWYRLWFRLESGGPLTAMTVEILEPVNLRFEGPALRPDGRTVRFDPPMLGERTYRRLEWTDDEPRAEARIRVTCSGEAVDDVWAMTTTVKVPVVPRIF